MTSHEETAEEDTKRGVKRSPPRAEEEPPPPSAAAACDWEHVDMGGDDQRKSKFLRLMGANKKEHRGRFVIGGDKKPATYTRSAEETEHLTRDLEGQYRQGLDFKLSGSARAHKGLGFEPSTDWTPERPTTFVRPVPSDVRRTDFPREGEEREAEGEERETGEGEKDDVVATCAERPAREGRESGEGVSGGMKGLVDTSASTDCVSEGDKSHSDESQPAVKRKGLFGFVSSSSGNS